MTRALRTTSGALRCGLALALGGAALLLPIGCHSPQAFAEGADNQVYAILEARRLDLEADLGSVDIIRPEDTLRARLLDPDSEHPPVVLDLVSAVEIAAENSREYQRRKEQLYLTALDLTLERWRFQVQETGTLGALVTGTGGEADDLLMNGSVGFSKLLGSGARIVGDIGLSMFRVLTTGDAFDTVSSIGLSVTQPLLAGFGGRIVKEPLTQAERNVIYEVRAFERYRRTFTFDVIVRYLQLVRAADGIRNQQVNYDALIELRRRNEAWGEAGRLSLVEVDQARQDEVDSRDTLLQAEQNFRAQLDDFKFFLGLPPQADIQVTPEALVRLYETEPTELPFDDADQLAQYALQWRLDHQTVLDQVDDAGRKVMVAADALRNVLDFSAGARLDSTDDHPFNLDLSDVNWSVGLSADLALNRLPQRNVYRSTLISLQLAQRNAEQSEDSIRLELRDALREAERTLQSWVLQKSQVALNERREENTRLEMEAGRATTRDILDSTRSLLSAKNAATSALIDQYVAVLAMWRDLEILRFGPDGPYADPELLGVLTTSPQEPPQP
jgi:outer membrane protein TolC